MSDAVIGDHRRVSPLANFISLGGAVDGMTVFLSSHAPAGAFLSAQGMSDLGTNVIVVWTLAPGDYRYKYMHPPFCYSSLPFLGPFPLECQFTIDIHLCLSPPPPFF